VRRIGDEPLLLLERIFQPRQQIIYRRRQAGKLVAFIRHIESRRQIVGRNAACLLVHQTNRRQTLAREDVTANSSQQQNPRHACKEVAPETTQTLIDDAEGFRDRRIAKVSVWRQWHNRNSQPVNDRKTDRSPACVA
jgi:hypothetical protein